MIPSLRCSVVAALIVGGILCTEPAVARPYKVALDIGHTVRSHGAVSASGVPEFRFNQQMVRLIAADLEQQPGISVQVINPMGKSISLLARSAAAKSANADLFLSIHHDSANDRYLKPHQVGDRIFKQTTRFQGYSVFFSQKNVQHERSLDFAKAIGRALREEGLRPTAHHAEKIPGEGRDLIDPELGVYRYDELIVLWSTKMPAVLLECGLIVNPIEEAQLNEPEHQQKIVRAVRHAVLKMAETR